MPEPDPQPPQPRLISPARWLLMLTPSALAIAAPFVGEIGASAFGVRGERALGAVIFAALLTLTVATVLCFVLGFLLEKWRGNNPRSWPRVIGCGFLILIVNGIISFAGCAVMFR